ncbi:MAG: Rho termination factor N-terminal domain-containing protein [Mycoplasmatales bacterium]|nr:Rho termination factor N-terminal domain-containing protein [Mycoplasmatales bacterium]
MINPNMMGQMSDVPTTKELWKNEKSKYRHWVILFGISILSIFILLLTSFILNLVNESSIKEAMTNWALNPDGTLSGKVSFDATFVRNNGGDAKVVASWVDSYYLRNTFWLGSIQIAVVFIGMILYGYTIYESYKNHSFAKISKIATFIVGLGAFIGIFKLFGLFRGGDTVIFQYPEGIYEFVLWFLPILIFIFISLPLNKIRRSFQISERYEQFKNSPQYEIYKNQMDAMQNGQFNQGMGPMGMGPMGMGAYGPMNQPMGNPNNPTPPTNNPTSSTEENTKPKKELSDKEKKIKELSKMKIVDLKKIAKKLMISGYKTMKKSELIDAISRLTENN